MERPENKSLRLENTYAEKQANVMQSPLISRPSVCLTHPSQT